MKAVLLHGTDGNKNDYFWFTDTKLFLESQGYEVWWPQLPNTERPVLEESLEFIASSDVKLDDETIIIGHSSACPLILHWLENENVKVKQVILVAGFYEPINELSKLMLKPSGFDYESLKDKADEFVLINSDDDPWGCYDQQARQPAINLGAKMILNSGEGHMGSGSWNQPYRKFDLLKKLISVRRITAEE